ncbi:recombinase family protein [Eubacteriales bacterium OttesenSCG-928-N13]|nr:recombinase family protein [Eubacteriales bacterium OttesenSCG-928-N13]
MNRTITRIAPTAVELPRLRKVCGYVRVSSPKDAMLHSLSAQVSYYNDLIQKTRGWAFAGIFTDEAKTGTKENRQGFQQLLEACRAGKVDMVITKSISRLARNTVTVLQMVRELKALGIDIYFEREKIHTISAEGELLLTLLASFAQEESRSASQNVKWRVKQKFSRGEVSSGIQMYGYRMVDGVLRIVPEEAEVIRLVAQYYLEGLGGTRIMELLNEAGYASKTGRQWNEHTIREMILNEKLAGDMLLQKSYIDDPISKKVKKNKGELAQYHVSQSHEPILDRGTYERIIAEHTSRVLKYQPNPTTRKSYPFSSKMVCGICGDHFRRKIAGSAPQYKKPVWICHTYNQRGKKHCPSRQIPEDILMEVTARVLGIPEFDSAVFAEQIQTIHVPAVDRLVFCFYDGRIVERTWQNRSRSESWTDEMRQRQRVQSVERSGK